MLRRLMFAKSWLPVEGIDGPRAPIVDAVGRAYDLVKVLFVVLHQRPNGLIILGFPIWCKSDSIFSTDLEVGMTARITRGRATASDFRNQSGRVKDGRISRRLLAIALVLVGVSRKAAAESCGMGRQTLRDRAYHYNAEGIERLSNRGGGGVKPLLFENQMAQLSR
jgi:hypothetical protein